MNGATLRAALSHLPNLETSECMDGSVVLRYDGMLDYALIQPWLHTNDAELRISPEGAIIVKAVTETARYETDRIDAEATGFIECGPIRQHQHTRVSTTSAVLDAFLRRPNILKVSVGAPGVNVDELKPSVVKDGLAHRKRKGLVNPSIMKHAWPTSSTTQKRAAAARRRSQKWFQLFR